MTSLSTTVNTIVAVTIVVAIAITIAIAIVVVVSSRIFYFFCTFLSFIALIIIFRR